MFLLMALLTLCYTVALANELDCASEQAKSGCIKASLSPEYYIEQSVLYFRTMETRVVPWIQPNYAENVVRWEWPPWLWLTGYGRWNLIWTDTLLKLFPTSYHTLNCRYFETQPFGRCHVVFDYSGHLCPIYEEFTFNQQGEITFIEAWSDYPELLPMDKNDTWAEASNVKRLSTKIPGLGSNKHQDGLSAKQLGNIETEDADIKNLQSRLKSPYTSYFNALWSDETDVSNGCNEPEKN